MFLYWRVCPLSRLKEGHHQQLLCDCVARTANDSILYCKMASTATPPTEYSEKKEVDQERGISPETEKGSVGLDGPQNTNADPNTTIAILDLVQAQDAHHPMNWPAWKRWSICFFYCWLQVFITITSTSYVSAEFPINDMFGGNLSPQVLTLGQSMFIVGNAVGPAFMGPLSDIGGRKWIYVASISCYAILNFVGVHTLESRYEQN